MVRTGFAQTPFFPDIQFCLEAPICDIPVIVFPSRNEQAVPVVEEAVSVITTREAEYHFV